MHVTYFHTFQDVSQLLCELVGPNEHLTMTAISTETPCTDRPTVMPDAWIVDMSSLLGWTECSRTSHGQGRTPVLASLDSVDQPNVWCRKLNVDGLIHLDLSRPASDLARHIIEVVTSTAVSSASTAAGATCAVSTTTVSAVTRDDQVNTRILNLITHGLSDKDIAASMCLSTHTVRNRISRMLQDGGFQNRTSLALFFSNATRERIRLQLRHSRTPSTHVAP